MADLKAESYQVSSNSGFKVSRHWLWLMMKDHCLRGHVHHTPGHKRRCHLVSLRRDRILNISADLIKDEERPTKGAL